MFVVKSFKPFFLLTLSVALIGSTFIAPSHAMDEFLETLQKNKRTIKLDPADSPPQKRQKTASNADEEDALGVLMMLDNPTQTRPSSGIPFPNFPQIGVSTPLPPFVPSPFFGSLLPPPTAATPQKFQSVYLPYTPLLPFQYPAVSAPSIQLPRKNQEKEIIPIRDGMNKTKQAPSSTEIKTWGKMTEKEQDEFVTSRNKKGWPQTALAKLAKCRVRTIKERMGKLGLKPPASIHLPKEKIKQLEKLLKEGKTDEEIAIILKCTEYHVYRHKNKGSGKQKEMDDESSSSTASTTTSHE